MTVAPAPPRDVGRGLLALLEGRGALPLPLLRLHLHLRLALRDLLGLLGEERRGHGREAREQLGLGRLVAAFSGSDIVSMALATTRATTSLMYASASASAAAATDMRAPRPRTAACTAVAAAS